MDATTVEELLRARIGLDPASAGPGLVARAVRARLKDLGLPDDADGRARYLALLDRPGAELEALVEEVVVSESWFFRDEQPFSFLADRLTADPGRPPLRVLSVPCARGEEPYSVAVALLDRGLTPDRFRVVGVDLSRKALAFAREGVYTDNAFRSNNLGFRDRHFRRTARGYEIGDAAKAAVEFRQGNIVDPFFLATEAPFDAVFCRNLLIYLDPPARRRALEHLDRLLAPDGLVFVGHAEHLGALSPRFRQAGETYCFAFERVGEGGRTPARAFLPAVREAPRPPARVAPRPAGAVATVSTPRAAVPAAFRLAGPVEPPPAAPQEPAPPPAPQGSVLEEAARLADRGRHAEAAALCEDELRRAGPSAAVFYLLGVVRQAAGRRDEAERCFEKAVYLDPRHDEALLALSAAARRRGDLSAAANYLRRAGRAAEEGTTR